MNRVCSVFRQILNVFSRSEFDQLARKHGAERHARGFTCWDQFVAMLFCHLGRAQSLREICGGLASAEGKLNHLGIDSAPAKSTLAYANAHRPWQVYESLFYVLLDRCKQAAPKRRLKFKNALLSLDSTVIDLCASVFDWAKFRTTKGGIKVHMLLDNQGLLPSYALITDAKTSDIRPAREMSFSPGTILVFDRGYNDFLWFVTLTLQGVWFVTRMKDGTRYRAVERREIPRDGAVLRDEVIELDVNLKPYDIELDSPVLFRRVEVRVPDRASLQGPQTKSPHQDLRWNFLQRPPYPDLDRSDRHADPSLSPTQVAVRLVALESAGHAPLQPVRVSRSLGMAGLPLLAARTAAQPCAAQPDVIRTAALSQ